MKTKEFIANVVKLGLITETTHSNIEIWNSGDYTELATVGHDEMFGIVTGFNFYGGLSSETRSKLFNLLVEYASTPIEKREKEKKYYFYLNHFDNRKENYLNYNMENGSWIISHNIETLKYKTKFTLSELPDWVHEMLEQGHLVKEATQ